MTIKIPLADNMFIQFEKSLSLGGGNSGVTPTFFEWEQAEPSQARFVTDSCIKNAKGEGQVALLLESFFLHPENYFDAISKPFDYILTHNRYFADNYPNCLWYPKGGSWVAFDQWGMRPKTKDISIILSPKNTMPGHKLAHQIAEKFKDRVDVFGLDGYVTKPEGLAEYRFSIVVEAERCHGFFSEKLIDCMSVKTVPVYWGDPHIEKYFNNGVWSFADLFELEQILNTITAVKNIDAYEILTGRCEVNLENAKLYRIAEDWIYQEYPFLFGDKS